MSEAGLNLTLALTGASGAALARILLDRMERDTRTAHIDLVASPHGWRVVREELAIADGTPDGLGERLLGRSSAKIQTHDDRDIGANIASGSYPNQGMIVAPCSMRALAAIAHGLADSLVERAADVCLKERRPLILGVRETPFNRIHLRNMLAADEAGAIVFPIMPAFYDRAETVDAMLDQLACRMLEHLGLPQKDAFQWTPLKPNTNPKP